MKCLDLLSSILILKCSRLQVKPDVLPLLTPSILTFDKKMINLNTLSIYTDGSEKEGRGSWAFLIVKNNQVTNERSGLVIGANSNQMEYQAAIEAMKSIAPGTKAIIYSDFRVLIETATKWIPEWKAQGWVKKRNKQIHYLDQIKEIDALILDREITWRWIPAHRGQAHNERCNQLCILARS